MIPLWLKLLDTAFVAVLVVVYARTWGWANFLWFSDIALILSVPALWFESPLLTSVMALAIALPDGLWIVSFIGQLISRKRLIGLADYMFDASKPRWLRALSLFHLWLPILSLWTVAQLGYARDALVWMTLLCWVVLPICFFFTNPEENINWAFGFGGKRQTRRSARSHLLLAMAGFPLIVYLPTHALLSWLFG